jgi:hypothetical protein
MLYFTLAREIWPGNVIVSQNEKQINKGKNIYVLRQKHKLVSRGGKIIR